jgi:restriction system protein
MPEALGARAVEQGFVAIGWAEIGDPRSYPDREALKAAVTRSRPEDKPGSWPVSAGVLHRFVSEIQAGDLVVHPSKHDRLVHIGRFVGPLERDETAGERYPNRRRVQWLSRVARSECSQSALNEIGSALTLFLVKRHAAEFIAKAGLPAATARPFADVEAEEVEDDDTATATVSQQAAITTADFIIRQITAKLSGHEFETFVAHLLECMGYTTRVTPPSRDGGVDVIAHRDRLGFEPPIVKAQCKCSTASVDRPALDQLLGTLGDGEYGLFVTLGSFNRESIQLERNRPKLRLIDGEQFVELVMQHYGQLAPRYRSVIPLKQIYVPDLQG